MAKRGQGATPAIAALARAGIRFAEHAYEHDPAETDFGREAAEALDIAPERVFKTLLVVIEGGPADGALVVGVVPVSGLLDLKAIASVVGGKRAQMAAPAVAERRTGYVVGGISPVGQRARLRTVLDESARRHATILVSGGRRGLDIELAPDDLLAVTDGEWGRIGRIA